MFHCFRVSSSGPSIITLYPGRVIVDASIFKRTSPLAREAHVLNSVAFGYEYGGPYNSPSPPTISPRQLVATNSSDEPSHAGPSDAQSVSPVPLSTYLLIRYQSK